MMYALQERMAWSSPPRQALVVLPFLVCTTSTPLVCVSLALDHGRLVQPCAAPVVHRVPPLAHTPRGLPSVRELDSLWARECLVLLQVSLLSTERVEVHDVSTLQPLQLIDIATPAIHLCRWVPLELPYLPLSLLTPTTIQPPRPDG
jgi:hypothetical protein